MCALGFELALLQEEILALEFDHAALAQVGTRMITICTMVEPERSLRSSRNSRRFLKSLAASS